MKKSKLLKNSDKFIKLSVDYFCIINQQGFFEDLSDNWPKLLGFSIQELKDRPFLDFVHSEDVASTKAENQKLLETKTGNYINRYITKDGGIVYLSWRAAASPDEPELVYAIATDVTKSQSDRKILETTQEITNTGGWTVDLNNNNCHWSNKVYEIHEVEPGTPIKIKEAIDYYTPEHRKIITKCINKAITENKKWDVELQIITEKKNRRWVRAIGHPVIVDGKTAALEGVFQDIHERKTKELEVYRNNAILTATFDSFPSSLIFADKNHEILEVSSFFEKDFGYKIEEVRGKTTDFLYKNSDDFHDKSAKKFYENANIDLIPTETEYVRKDGSLFWGQTIGSAIFDQYNETIGYISAIRDLTQEKMYEVEMAKEQARMIQASKMSTLGEMAGGIAHEINNPLAIVQGYAQKLESLSKSGPTVSSEVTLKLSASLLKAVERMAKIILGLRIFARDGRSEAKHIIKSDKIIEETLSFCGKRFQNHDVELIVKSDSNAKIYGQEIQLSQVLLNLLNNAFDAVKSEGAHKEEIEIEVNSSKTETLILVKDWGPGISEEDRDKILEPFYTTKDIGKGTGLGLSISKGIIEDHHGTLTVESLNEPTVLRVSLPNSASAAGVT